MILSVISVGNMTACNIPYSKYADAPAARVSLKEKLEAMKVRVAGGDAEKTMPQKVKGREETL